MRVAIIDYGSGNLRSAAKAFERAAAELGLPARIDVTGDADALRAADRIVLPGVGAFADCKAGLAAVPGMIESLEQAVHGDGRPFLGICVGMQLLARRGHEHVVTEGLGWLDAEVVPLAPDDPSLKIPQMGWNELALDRPDHPLLAGIEPGSHGYFVHSYKMACRDGADIAAHVDYGGPVTSVVARANIAGTQFHPEKSQAVGLRLIANFLQWQPG